MVCVHLVEQILLACNSSGRSSVHSLWGTVAILCWGSAICGRWGRVRCGWGAIGGWLGGVGHRRGAVCHRSTICGRRGTIRGHRGIVCGRGSVGHTHALSRLSPILSRCRGVLNRRSTICHSPLSLGVPGIHRRSSIRHGHGRLRRSVGHSHGLLRRRIGLLRLALLHHWWSLLSLHGRTHLGHLNMLRWGLLPLGWEMAVHLPLLTLPRLPDNRHLHDLLDSLNVRDLHNLFYGSDLWHITLSDNGNVHNFLERLNHRHINVSL
mmetsp:Transcript_66988/g.146102  ORF Transcript_66988/g.146102 Transcript_66988/m.146102 type:complete len:265 (-) Transcript_66988:588-1382(-)